MRARSASCRLQIDAEAWVDTSIDGSISGKTELDTVATTYVSKRRKLIKRGISQLASLSTNQQAYKLHKWSAQAACRTDEKVDLI